MAQIKYSGRTQINESRGMGRTGRHHTHNMDRRRLCSTGRKVQPMKLAAMEGLYRGKCGQELVGFGLLNTDKRPYDGQDAINYEISIPKGLSILANHDANSFVPGIEDLLDGISVDANGDTINTISYAERITIGREAQDALRAYNEAEQRGRPAGNGQRSHAAKKKNTNSSDTDTLTAPNRPYRL